MSGCRIGIDLGGTKICGVAVDEERRVARGPLLHPTQRQRPSEQIVATLVAAIEELTEEGDVDAVGIGIPTTLDSDGGLVACPNLPTMSGVNLHLALERHLGRAVVMDNDANCFTYGEWRAGAGRGTSVCCGITLGTGFGMGIIVGGRQYRGGHGDAGEIWCSPLGDGHEAEDIISGIGVAARYEESTGQSVDAQALAQRAREGDAEAARIWREYGEALGSALTYAVNILDPEVVVVGGSMAAALDLFGPDMHGVLEKYAYNYERLKIAPAELGPASGAVGAALLGENEP